MPIPSTLPADLSSRIDSLLAELPTPETVQPGHAVAALPSDLASIIDHTLLAPNSTTDQIRAIVNEANTLGAATFCINASLLPIAADELAKSQSARKAKPICVVSFPFGTASTEAKVEETKQAVRDGAREIDMVQNVGWIRSKEWNAVWKDVNAVVKAAGQDVPVK